MVPTLKLRARLGAVIATAFLLLAPAAALGGTLRVNPAHSGGCSESECKTIAEAVAAAQAGDTIQILAGTYSESPTVDKQLTIKGSGAETKLIGSGTGDVLTLSADGVSVENLAVQVATDAQSAIVMNGADTVLNTVVAQRTGGIEPVIDVVKGLARIEKSYVIQGSTAPGAVGAIRSSAAAGLHLTGSVAISSKGPAVLFTASDQNRLTRATLATIDETANGVEVRSLNGSAAKKKLVVDSTVILGGTGAAGIYGFTEAGSVSTLPTPSTAGSVDLLVRHATVIAGKGIIAEARANHAATDADHGDVKAQVFSSIVHGESRTVNYAGAPALFSANEASIAFSASDAPEAPDHPGVTRDAATGFTPQGQIFRSGSFALRADAPVIDKGGVVDSGESDTDIDGEPRAVDGNRDGVVASDIGADEFVNKAPTARFGATKQSPKQGEAVGFISGSTDPEQASGGGIVEYRWDFGDGAKEAGPSGGVAHTYAQRGSYKVTLTTVDKQGATTTSDPVTVNVRDGVAPTVAIAVPEGDRVYKLNPKPRKGSKRKPVPLQLGAVGSAIDEESVAKIEVALTLTKRDPVAKPKKKKARKKKTRRKRGKRSQTAQCEHFTGTAFAKRGCESLEWIEVSVIGTGWTFATPKGMRVPAGRYQMRVRAVDAQGNATPTPKVSDKTLVGFRVS